MSHRRAGRIDPYRLVHQLSGMSTLWSSILHYLRQIPGHERARLFLPATLQGRQLSHCFGDSGIPEGEVYRSRPFPLRRLRTCNCRACRTLKHEHNHQR
ncbi:ORF3 protein [Duck circovirus]|uniref:ORF3 n=1 Tax=Duck circovirus TaxID=324685 RepID=W8KV64_9CIRC|nr:ORF3 protein [Duck circovirus]QDC17548.1 ORF3 [Duck circovirus]